MMGEEEKYLDAFRTTLPVLIDREMKKIRRQQRGMTLLICALLGVNMLMFGAGLWIMARSHTVGSAGETAAGTEQRLAAPPAAAPPPAAPQETVDVLADLPAAEKEAVAEPAEPATIRIDRSHEVIRHSLDKMRQEAEQRQQAADAAAVRQQPAGSGRPDFVVTQGGMTLRSLARRYYGSEVFWVCIYDRNSEALRSPDVLPLGVRLHLPRPADYGIDASDPSSLRRARALAKSLVR